MAYGTPYQEEDIIPYYTHIRHGKRPSDDMIDDLKNRYKHIGGISPLAKITLAQAKKLEEALNSRQNKVEYVMYLGLKHISPFIEDAVEQMKRDQMEEAVSIVLAPTTLPLAPKSTIAAPKRPQKKSADRGSYQLMSGTRKTALFVIGQKKSAGF